MANEAFLKFLPDFLKRKAKPEDAPAGPEPVDYTPNLMARLKAKVFQPKDEPPAPAAAEDSAGSLEALKEKLTGLIDKKSGNHTRNTILLVAGGGLAIAGMAADVMFLGGMGTATVVGILYSDLRNAQHISKISAELSKIDEKIDQLKTTQQPVPDYAPTLSAMRSAITDFESSAQKLPPDAREGLDRLKTQMDALQEKISPANDDGAKPARPAATP
jgi:type VI protein secretion system component VasK